MRNIIKSFLFVILGLFTFSMLSAQSSGDSTDWKSTKKNIIRYNLSSAILFGIDKTFIVGCERLLKPNRSISINVGKTALPKFVSITTDSVSFSKDLKNNGFNFSADYRFYLSKLNKFNAPRGVYIGPYYSLNLWHRDNEWKFSNASKFATTQSDVSLHMAGIELGYQFIFWNRVALDMILIGPGVGFYKVEATAEDNLTPEEREQLQDAFVQAIQQKFPGFNYVFSDQKLDASGLLRTSSIGFRYLIHVGFNF